MSRARIDGHKDTLWSWAHEYLQPEENLIPLSLNDRQGQQVYVSFHATHRQGRQVPSPTAPDMEAIVGVMHLYTAVSGTVGMVLDTKTVAKLIFFAIFCQCAVRRDPRNSDVPPLRSVTSTTNVDLLHASRISTDFTASGTESYPHFERLSGFYALGSQAYLTQHKWALLPHGRPVVVCSSSDPSSRMALLTLKGARLFPEFSIERTWNYTRLRLGQAPKHSTFKRPVATSVQPTLLKEHGDKLPSLTRRMLEVLQHLELPTDHGMDGSSILNPITRKELGNHLKNQAHARFDLSEPWVYSKNWQQHSCLQAPLSVLTDCMLSMAQKAPNNCHLLSRAVFLLPFWSLRKALHLKAALTELADPALAYMVEKLWLQQLDHTQRVPWKLIETPDQQLDGEEPDHLEFVSMEVDHPDTDYEQSESDHEPHAKRGPGVPIQPVDPVLKNTVSKLVALCINRWESLQKDLQKLILFIRDDFMGSPALYGQPMAKHAVLHQLHQAYLHAPVSDTLHLQHWRVCNDYELIHQLMCTTFKQQVRSFQKRVQSRKALLSTYLQDSAVHHQRLMLELQKLWTCGQEATGAALPVSLMRQGRLHANPKIRGQTVPLPLDHPLHCQAMLSQVKFAGQTPMGCEESHQYRRVHASSFGFLDPNHTPEDTKCGEVDYLLEHVRQSPRLNAKQHLSRLGYVHTPPDDLEPCEGFTWCWGLLAHPKVLGLTNVQQQLHSLQQLKQPYLKSSDVILLFNGLPVAYAKNRAHEVKYWAFSVRLLRQLYPKTLWSLSCYVVPPVSPHSPTVLELDVRPGRLMRPLRLVNQPNQIEWLDASELNHRHIRIGLWPHDYLQRVHSSQLTHYEYGSPDTLVLGPVLRQVPYANHTKAARLTITAKTECQRLDAPQRFLKLLYPIEDPLTRYLRDLPRSIAALAYPSKPLVYTSRQITRCHSTQMKTHTDLKVKVEVQHQERVSLRGNSLLVAVMDTGDNLEDCAVINPAAIQRGALMVEETMVLNTTVAFVQEDLSEYSKLLNRYGTEASDSFTPLPEEDQGVLKPVWSHCRTGPDPVHHLPGLIHLNKKRAIHPGDPVLTFQDGKSVLRWATTDYSVPTGATDYVLDDVDIEYVPFASGHRLMPDLDDQWVAFRQRKEGATFDEKEWRLQRQVEQRLAKQAEGAVHGAKEDVPRTSYAFRFTFTRMRQLQDGDKCTTNGQKFTIKHFFGSVEDMPWISHAQDPSFRGVQPDLIMHPSCIISRATLGFQAEGLSSTLALRDGQRRDGTAFRSAFKKHLEADPTLPERFYCTMANGHTGAMLQQSVAVMFMQVGVLHHFSAEKLNVASAAYVPSQQGRQANRKALVEAMNPVTGQPHSGRRFGNGLSVDRMLTLSLSNMEMHHTLNSLRQANHTRIPVCGTCGTMASTIQPSTASEGRTAMCVPCRTTKKPCRGMNVKWFEANRQIKNLVHELRSVGIDTCLKR